MMKAVLKLIVECTKLVVFKSALSSNVLHWRCSKTIAKWKGCMKCTIWQMVTGDMLFAQMLERCLVFHHCFVKKNVNWLWEAQNVLIGKGLLSSMPSSLYLQRIAI